MNILSALYAGQQGLLKGKEALDRKNAISPAPTQELPLIEVDKAQIKASARVVSISNEIFKELGKIAQKK